MKTVFVFLCLVLISTSALADVPIEISASQSLEWDRKAKTYTARGNVVAVQGKIRVQSDTLVAHYNDSDSGVSIRKLEAKGNVTIQSEPYVARGTQAVYDIATRHAVLTGDNLSVTTGSDILTAQEKIEFFERENRLVAKGTPQVTNGRDTISADTMNALFKSDTKGARKADKFTAEGNVTVKTSREIVTGDAGIYDVATQKAILTGKVMIRQNDSWIEGRRADIDMQKGASQLSGEGNAETNGRVRGVFYPGAKTNPTDTKAVTMP